MTREEAKELLGNEATEERITDFLNKYHNKEKAKNDELNDLKTQLNEANNKVSDYDTMKQKLDDINKANMTEQEKLEEMQKQAKLNLKNSQIIYNTAKAKELLAGENVDEALINSLVSDSEQDTITKVNLLKQTLTNLKDNVAKATKETLTNANLNPSMSNVNQNENVMTMDKFMNLSADEQEKFINEYPDEFNNL